RRPAAYPGGCLGRVPVRARRPAGRRGRPAAPGSRRIHRRGPRRVAPAVLTIDALRRADPARLAEAGTAWRRLADVLAGQTAELDRRLVALRTGWTGDAAQAATGLLVGLCTELDAAGPNVLGLGRAVLQHP